MLENPFKMGYIESEIRRAEALLVLCLEAYGKH